MDSSLRIATCVTDEPAGSARRRPDVILIVGHLRGLMRVIDAGLALPNVYCDVSCPDIVWDVRLAKALAQAGAERLIMGSDTPYSRRAVPRCLRRVRRLDLPYAKEAPLLGGGIARLLRLSRR